jgi:hypothetical protein
MSAAKVRRRKRRSQPLSKEQSSLRETRCMAYIPNLLGVRSTSVVGSQRPNACVSYRLFTRWQQSVLLVI